MEKNNIFRKNGMQMYTAVTSELNYLTEQSSLVNVVNDKNVMLESLKTFDKPDLTTRAYTASVINLRNSKEVLPLYENTNKYILSVRLPNLVGKHDVTILDAAKILYMAKDVLNEDVDFSSLLENPVINMYNIHFDNVTHKYTDLANRYDKAVTHKINCISEALDSPDIADRDMLKEYLPQIVSLSVAISKN